jgi:hypothetical protein
VKITQSGKEPVIDKLYKIVGILIFVVATVVAFCLQQQLNIREVQTENDFMTAMLHSDGVYAMVEKIKLAAAVGISGLGFCLGFISYGIGVILGRQRTR